MKKIISSLFVAALLAGCSSATIQKMEAKVDVHREMADKALTTVRAPDATGITYSDSSYIPLRKLDRQEYSAAQRATLATEIEVNRNFRNLNEIASWLSSVIGTPVYINPELMSQASGPGVASVPTVAPMPTPMPPGSPLGGLGQGQVNSVSSNTNSIAGKSFNVAYTGAVLGFLDIVSAQYGTFWKIDGANIRLLLTDSRTFRIKALPGDTQLSSTVGSTSSSAGSGGTSSVAGSSTASGTSNNSTGVSFSGLSVWAGVESAIRQMLTPNTGKVAISPSTGTVSVTDTPRVLDRVAEFVKEQNASLSRQVAVNVRVLSVEISDGDNYGINWNAVYNNLTDNVALGFKSAFPVAAGAANFVLQTSTPSSNQWGSASGAIISALSTQGRVSELTSATVVTLNNQPAPVNVGRQVSYLASSATTQAANAGTTTSLTPGQVQTGFSMVLVPHIIDGKELLLQASINLSSLLQMATITSGGSSIQSPDLSTSNFIQRVKLMSGDTLVMAGFDQDQLSAVSKGVGAATNDLFGSRDSSGKRTMLVILIQPSISL